MHSYVGRSQILQYRTEQYIPVENNLKWSVHIRWMIIERASSKRMVTKVWVGIVVSTLSSLDEIRLNSVRCLRILHSSLQTALTVSVRARE